MTDRRIQQGIGVLLALVATVLVVTAIAAAMPAGSALVVEDASTGEQLLTVPVSEGTPVVLAYMHSVEKTPVRDIYTVRNKSLVMTRMKFQSYGWGLPARADITRKNGWFVFDPSGNYEEIYVKPGRTADHQLRVGNQTYDLVSLSNAQGVRLYITEQSILETTFNGFN
jgi:hypothetical protein